MAMVAGVDFGTLSVRVSIVDSKQGLLSSAISEYPLHRKRDDPEYATQSHHDHMRALAEATREAVKNAGIKGDQLEAIALDTTGSSVIPVGKDLAPLGEYYLSGAITGLKSRLRKSPKPPIAKSSKPLNGAAESTHRNGGSRSCCTGFATIPPSVRSSFPPSNIATWLPRRYAASPTQKRSSAAFAPWDTNGCGTLLSAVCRQKNS